MSKIVEVLDDGFRFSLDSRIYPQQAVKKALFRWMHKYYVSISLIADYQIEATCRLKTSKESLLRSDSDRILNDLMFEALRVEVIAETSSIRELLVGRALYATCIEVDPKEATDTINTNQNESWVEDSKQILTSWNEDRRHND